MSPCDEMHVCTERQRQTETEFILSSERVLGGMEFEPMLTPREKSPLPENVPRGESNPRRCGQRAQALPTELFRPHTMMMTTMMMMMIVVVVVVIVEMMMMMMIAAMMMMMMTAATMMMMMTTTTMMITTTATTTTIIMT